jgi:hypothetical protein
MTIMVNLTHVTCYAKLGLWPVTPEKPYIIEILDEWVVYLKPADHSTSTKTR